MTFQASDLKEKQFLNLIDSNENILELSYIKGGSWLKFFSHSNSLYARAMRTITNYALIGKYNIDLDFSPEKSLVVYVGYTPSNQDVISFISAKGLTNTEI